ncbi:hypothetical protein ANN_03687 [Periplaneta americana]|uniref:RNase H type-1 domain-containing protein n=1 Tax=Periplaneta americana TaxID=6978 RepID=A0ABQ8TZP0_PERAM|nr:hypothetical protein ANN_03687 [Periplaneta americana]
MHACEAHCPLGSEEIQCLWERCDAMKRKRFSLMTHLYDRHCNADVLRMMAVRRRQLSQSGRSEIPPPQPPPPHPGYAPNAAFHAIKRHALEFVNPKEMMKGGHHFQHILHLYTDGSLISREQGAGAGVTCCLFSLYRSLGYGATSFDGEIIAISESLRNLLCHINKFKNAVTLSDSKAAILSIVSKHTPSPQTAEITKMLSQLISLNKRIVFQWIPSHCGILGNENVDALAKKGSTATYRPVSKSTYYSVKRFIKSTYLDFNKQNLITKSQEKKWNSLHHNPQLIPNLPRKSSVAAFRLATGHDCLAKHLHRIGIYQSPNCPLCNSNQEMDSEHLKICASVAGHDNICEKYWSARGQMTLLSNAWH